MTPRAIPEPHRSEGRPQTAMLLTDDEWTSLAHVCNHFLMATSWADDVTQHKGYSPRTGSRRQPPTQALLEQRDVARRVVGANQ